MNQRLRVQGKADWSPYRRSTAAFSRAAKQYISTTLFIVICSGCARGVFTPKNLPDNLVARPVISATQLNLAGLDGGAINLNAIYPGDVLQVTVVTGADERRDAGWRLRVDQSGALVLPQVGPIRVAGLELIAAERLIGDVYRERQIYMHPSVSLTVEARRTKRVTVDGAVKKPGDYDLPSSNADIAAALLAAGGLTDEADTIVEVRQVSRIGAADDLPAPARASRGEQQASFQQSRRSDVSTRRIDLSDIGSENQAPQLLEDGASITVMKRPVPAVGVVGLVKNSKQLEFPVGKELRLLDAIAAAGGTSMELANQVYVVRRIPDGDETVIIKTSIRKAKQNLAWNVLLTPGDIVSVEETPQTFAWRGLNNILNSAFLALRLYTFPF